LAGRFVPLPEISTLGWDICKTYVGIGQTTPSGDSFVEVRARETFVDSSGRFTINSSSWSARDENILKNEIGPNFEVLSRIKIHAT
jgi:hypothetical protein